MKMGWLKLSVWIGTYGFLKEFRPEDPYITQYLVNPPMNFTQKEVNQDIFPVATYVSLSQLIIVFLLTDWLRYKPVIVVHALSGMMMQILLIWFRSKFAMYLMEYCYGTMMACEVAYYTYIYAKVEKKHYQIVTSHMRAASLSGRFISSLASQILLFFKLTTISELNHLTLAGMAFAFLWALTLPSVKTSMYFHRSNSAMNFSDCAKNGAAHAVITSSVHDIEQSKQPVLTKMCKNTSVLKRVVEDFKHAYTNPYVLKWSLWWAFATCGYYQIMTYVQLLWQQIHEEDRTMNLENNGAVEAIYTLISAFAAFCFGYVKADWKLYGEMLLGVCTLCEGFLVLWSSHISVIWHAYVVYIIFGMLYHIMMTVSNSEVARHIHADSYALIFGINGFVALCLQTVLTLLVSGKGGFELTSREQFMVYGMYFIILGVVFGVKAAFTKISHTLHYTIS